MLGPSHWLHEISLPKGVHHHFWPGLIPLAKNTLPIYSQGFTCALRLLGPAPTGTRTIALDPTFGSFTLLKPVSH